ncbi:sn-glycerol-1-phosphate dehydrogenase, partial [Paenibacillus sp.]|uniref:sn-glycerol-1-phosphate dehydrogenase n=1 Tax=Paenibacillus sp. TaxID=58172 RepID=UPI002D72B574
MIDILGNIRTLAERMGETAANASFPERIAVAPGAATDAAAFAEEAGYRRLLLVADANTFEAAGRRLRQGAEARRLEVETTLVKPNAQGDVVADEASVVQTLLDLQRSQAQAVLAVGAGTLHDVARYAAFTFGVPFISVPTAPSVDGFASKGAPLLVRGEKITVPAVGPVAVFADTDLLARAPRPLVAAGFGDMLGKTTSLFDWKFGAATAGEPYSPLVAAITERALRACVERAADIGAGKDEGIAALTGALIESGLAMLILGQSHPASGAEHHLSHYWEMEFIRAGRRQLLHGAKVGVASALVSELYRRIAAEG